VSAQSPPTESHQEALQDSVQASLLPTGRCGLGARDAHRVWNSSISCFEISV